jgi:ornithine cyclodeaminase/alanine dehydrogenase-like protein (mu-crystallin family)
VNPLFLTEGDVVATMTVRDALGIVEDAARALAEGGAQVKPRQRIYNGSSVLQVLPASFGSRMGHKTYTVAMAGRGAAFWVLLFNDGGEMLAIIQADALGQMRTGAASGVATRMMAREDSSTLAIIGTGWQARTQLEACAHVRNFRTIRAYGRDEQRRASFCEDMTARIGIDVVPAASAEEAVSDADVVCTMTSSTTPVLHGAWLKAGAHVNAAGSNRANAAEIDAETVRRAAIVAVEDIAQAHVESGDLLAAEREGAWNWDPAVLISDIVGGKTPGRTSDDQITLFESLGVGIWDVAAASFVFDACVAQGRGTHLAMPS